MEDTRKRDAAADLAACGKVTPHLENDGYAVLARMPDGGYLDVAVFSVWTQDERRLAGVAESPHRENAEFFVLASEALPHWIRRCVAAEAEAYRLREVAAAIVRAGDGEGDVYEVLAMAREALKGGA